MAEVFKIEVKGVKELQATFGKLEKEFQDALAEAVSQAAAVVEREAKINSGRGGAFPNRVTGNLMNSIKELRQTVEPNRVTSVVGSDMVYAPRLEYGFSGTDRLGRHYNQRPRPFLRPALDENEAQIQAAFEKSLREIISRYK